MPVYTAARRLTPLLALLVALQCLCPVTMARPAAGMRHCTMGQPVPQPAKTTRPCCLASHSTVAWLAAAPVPAAAAVTAAFLPAIAVATPPAPITAAAPTDAGPPLPIVLRL